MAGSSRCSCSAGRQRGWKSGEVFALEISIRWMRKLWPVLVAIVLIARVAAPLLEGCGSEVRFTRGYEKGSVHLDIGKLCLSSFGSGTEQKNSNVTLCVDMRVAASSVWRARPIVRPLAGLDQVASIFTEALCASGVAVGQCRAWDMFRSRDPFWVAASSDDRYRVLLDLFHLP
jgi:hypothetical protein